jgi:class 3 adenylate cyclase
MYVADGLMAYFGYPRAHEDDARRAVHAGLGILEEVTALNAYLSEDRGISLQVRIGLPDERVFLRSGKAKTALELLDVAADSQGTWE